MVEIDGEWQEVHVSGWRGKEVMDMGVEKYMSSQAMHESGKGWVWSVFDSEIEADMEEMLGAYNAQMIDSFLNGIILREGLADYSVIESAYCECQSQYHDIEDLVKIPFEDLFISRDGRDFICEECWNKEREEYGC